MPDRQPSNEQIADLLEQIARLLEAQAGANPFRVRAYRDGAATIRAEEQPVAGLVAQGDEQALQALPDIGEGLANVIMEYVAEGHSGLLAELQGEADPVALFATVPGIGPELAGRIVEQLDVTSLEQLEQAAHDGRLDGVPGFGPGRLKTVRTSLAGLLSGAAQAHRQRVAAGQDPDAPPEEAPPVSLLLQIDREYREKAEAGQLPTIAPNRFNPDDEQWLPIYKPQRDGWQFTALFSNTARAHELDKTDDWVVIYWQPASGGEERQNTVVTENSGPLAGKRVVRGREAETRQHYKKES